MGPHSPIRRRVPPMLDIALEELMGRRPHKMLAGKRRLGVDERHRVLQLVAKSVSPTGLIKTSAPPKTTAQNLVQQPAIGHQVHRYVRSSHLNNTKRLLPIFPSVFEGRLGGPCFTIAFNQALRVRQVATGSQAKPDLSFFAIWQIESHMHGPARIQPNTRLT